MRVEQVDFVTVQTEDKERSKQFYGEVLGLPLDRPTPSGYEFEAGNVTIEIFAPATFGMAFAPSPSAIALRVGDVAAARAELESRGVVFDAETIDTGVCHMAPFRDPDGNALVLHRRYAPR